MTALHTDADQRTSVLGPAPCVSQSDPQLADKQATSAYSNPAMVTHLQLRLQILPQSPLHRIQILLRHNPIAPPRLPTRQRQILRHDPININRIHTRLLQALRPRHHLRRVVQGAALHETTSPGENGGDRVGGGFAAFLVLAVVARDGAVGGFGFEGLAVGGYQDGGHEAEGAKTLGYDVGLDVAVVVCEGGVLAQQ